MTKSESVWVYQNSADIALEAADLVEEIHNSILDEDIEHARKVVKELRDKLSDLETELDEVDSIY